MSEVICIAALTLGVFLFGYGVGVRTTRKDYEPLIDRVLGVLEKLERWKTTLENAVSQVPASEKEKT